MSPATMLNSIFAALSSLLETCGTETDCCRGAWVVLQPCFVSYGGPPAFVCEDAPFSNTRDTSRIATSSRCSNQENINLKTSNWFNQTSSTGRNESPHQTTHNQRWNNERRQPKLIPYSARDATFQTTLGSHVPLQMSLNIV